MSRFRTSSGRAFRRKAAGASGPPVDGDGPVPRPEDEQQYLPDRFGEGVGDEIVQVVRRFPPLGMVLQVGMRLVGKTPGSVSGKADRNRNI